MTDQLEPTQELAPERAPASFEPPAPTSRADKFKSEIVAGGAVTEHGDDELAGGWRGALAMAAIAALFVWLALVNIWIFLFVAGVVVSIFLHEMGHFLTARWTGMKVTQFFLFFGPRLWSFRRGETEYGVRAIPLGAFVRIVGMSRMDEVDPIDEGRTYRQKSFPRRMLVISAGSIMHLLLAIVLLFGVYAIAGERVTSAGASVVQPLDGGPAAVAGVVAGDTVVSVNGEEFTGAAALGDLIRRNDPGDVVTLGVVRDGSIQDITVTLSANEAGSALVGLRTASVAEAVDHSVAAAAGNAVTDIFPFAWESSQGVVKVLNPVNIVTHLAGTNDDLSSRPTTLYGVATLSDDVGDASGLAGLVLLLAVLNVFVGVFNMFPLLPLDGGHAAVAIYERIRELMRGGRQRYFADVERLMPYAMGVVTVLAMLMFAGLYLDISDPIG